MGIHGLRRSFNYCGYCLRRVNTSRVVVVCQIRLLHCFWLIHLRVSDSPCVCVCVHMSLRICLRSIS